MSEYLDVQMILITEFGEFVGKKTTITIEQYITFINMSKGYYQSGFELTCEDGTFMVFPPDIISKSILKIKKILKEDVQE